MEPPKSPGGLCVTIDAQDSSSEHPQSSDAEVEQADHGPYLRQPSISAAVSASDPHSAGVDCVAMDHVARRERISWTTTPKPTAFIELYRDGGSGSESRTVDWRWGAIP